MYVEYVRVYQREGVKNGVTCDPTNYPTADYIQKSFRFLFTTASLSYVFCSHINAYTNANLTTWAQAGYDFPRNSEYNGC